MRAVIVLVLVAAITFTLSLGWQKMSKASLSSEAEVVSISAVEPNTEPTLANGAGKTAPATALPQSTPTQKTRGLSGKIAQSQSNKCRISDGSICYVPAQPVGAPCTCPNNQAGVIVW